MANSRRRYLILILLAGVTIVSVAYLSLVKRPYTVVLFPGDPSLGAADNWEEPPSLIIWIPAFTAIISAIATISTVILAWRNDRRDARERELKIAKLEQELKEAREQSATSSAEKKDT